MTTNTPNVGNVGYVGSLEQVIDEVRNWYKRFVFVTSESDLDIIALWTIHTWLCEETYTTPRLLIDSPVPGSGKTTLLEHLNKLTYKPLQMAAISSAAMLARATSTGIRTLLLDEADRSLDPADPKTKDLVAILNSGYKKGGTRPVLVKSKDNFELVEMPTYSPVAIAGNSPRVPDDTKSRCITIRLMPAINGQIEMSDWEYIEEEVNALAVKISETTDNYREQVRAMKPELPDGCTNRLRERWRPLKRIASVASDRWASKVDELIKRDIENERELADNEEVQVSQNIQIARDVYKVFLDEPGFIPTGTLVLLLIKKNPAQWSSASYYGKDLTAQRLGYLLTKAWGIYSQRLNANTRGYSPNQFENIWSRLGITQSEPTQPTQPTSESELF